jgi:putative transposase
VKYAFIEAHRRHWRVTSLCHALRVSRSGYYNWRCRRPSTRKQANQTLLQHLREQHLQTRRAYGAVKMWQHLQRIGVACGKHRVANLRRLHELESLRQKRRRAAVAARHGHAHAPRLLTAPFKADQSNEVWLGDVTFIATRQGWLYLAILLDLYSRQVVGWSMQTQQNTELTLAALEMALHRRKPLPGLIHHTDRGKPYANERYQAALQQHGLVASMSRLGNCYDNAPAETFFSTLKSELVHHADFKSRAEARTAIFQFIEVFYNRSRLHQSLGYQTPSEYERMKAVA